MADFNMPSLGADMEEGRVVKWLVKPGDQVKRGDIVAVVETQKAAIEIEIFQSGVIDEIVVPEGTKVPIGTLLAKVRTDGASPAAPAVVRQATPAPAAPQAIPATGPAPAPHPTPGTAGERMRVSPLARRRAEELGVDLQHVKGTGIGGAITREDVDAAAHLATPAVAAPSVAAPPVAAPPVAAPVEGAAARQLAMREAIGALMARSKREIPHYYLATTIDFSTAQRWLEAENLKRAVADRILPSALLLKAVARAVRDVPEMNGFWIEGAFHPSTAVHLGVAIALRQGGLIAPAIHDADQKSLDDLMHDLKDLVARARAGILRGSEMSDPTITITNLGDQGVETVFGVIYAPQVALVGFGKIVERPWAAGGMLGVRPVVTATLAADHRVSDGHRGGRFLAAIDRILQEPEKL